MEPHRAGDNPVRVPRAVLDGIKAVRRTGLTNMLDRLTVRQIALLLGHKEAYEWIRDHSSEYAEGVFRGFEAEVEEGDIPT